MCLSIAITGTILFLILTPGILLRIPEKGPILKAAIIHSIIFGILLYFISKIIYQYINVENFYTTISPQPSIEDSIINAESATVALDILKNKIGEDKVNKFITKFKPIITYLIKQNAANYLNDISKQTDICNRYINTKGDCNAKTLGFCKDYCTGPISSIPPQSTPSKK